MRWKQIVLILIICLMLTNSVMAMSSPNFEIDWMVPLSGGGGKASSTNYAIHVTIGQTAVGKSESTNFQAAWGFWRGIWQAIWEVFIPVLLKNQKPDLFIHIQIALLYCTPPGYINARWLRLTHMILGTCPNPEHPGGYIVCNLEGTFDRKSAG